MATRANTDEPLTTHADIEAPVERPPTPGKFLEELEEKIQKTKEEIQHLARKRITIEEYQNKFINKTQAKIGQPTNKKIKKRGGKLVKLRKQKAELQYLIPIADNKNRRIFQQQLSDINKELTKRKRNGHRN